MQPSIRMLPALVVAFLAGTLRAGQGYASLVLVSYGFHAEQLSVVLPGLGLLALVLSPFGAAIAGYVWGVNVDVRERWLSFTVLTFLAAVVGFLATTLLMLALVVAGSGGQDLTAIAAQTAYQLITAVGLLGVALIALAGAGIAEFRTAGAEDEAAA